MNEETIWMMIMVCFVVPVVYGIMFMLKYHYISTICRNWNKKLYNYIEHLKYQKDLGNGTRNYVYLEKMYLYPDEVGIRLISDWSESDLILDKLTLFNVNKHNDEDALIKVNSYE